jgi:hypothetical protein
MEINTDPGVGYAFFDDFVNLPLPGTQTTELSIGRYKWFNTGGGVWTVNSSVNSVAIPGGILQNTLDTDNDTGSIGVNQPSFYLSGVASTSGKLWFEARIAYSPITTNGLGWFVGLGTTDLYTFATAVPFNAGDVVADTADSALIGFQKPEDDTTTFNSCYHDDTESATVVTAVGDGEGTYATAYAFTKIGFTYDPEEATNCIVFYQDGDKLTTAMTRAALVALTELDARPLSPMMSNWADSAGTAGKFYVDWWRCAQLRP